MRASEQIIIMGQGEGGGRSLPALPLSTGAKVVGFGHSAIQRGAFTGNASGVINSVGTSGLRAVLPWIRIWDDRFNLDAFADANNPFQAVATTNALNGAQQAIGGEHISYVSAANPGTLYRTPYIVARRPDIVYLHIGENDINSGGNTDASPIIALLDQQLTKLRNAGIWVAIQTLMPRGVDETGANSLWPTNDIRRTILADTNTWIKAQDGREGVKVCDTTAILGEMFPDLTLFGTDQIHPNPTGANAMAGVLLPLLQGMVSSGNVSNLDPTVSNLWPGYGLLGTTGTKIGTGLSGTVAAGHVANLNAGAGASSVVASKEVISGTLEKQVFVVTPGTDGNASRVHECRFTTSAAILLSSIGAVEGDWINSFVYVELSAWDYWLQVSLLNEAYAVGTAKLSASAGLANADSATQILPFGASGFSGWLKLCRWQVPVGSGSDRIRTEVRPIFFDWDKNGTGTGTIKISKPILRKMASPQPAWNL